MILHLLEDEKFVDSVVEQFEAVASGKSIYLIEINQPDGSIKYVKTSHPNMIFARCESDEFRAIVKDIAKFDAVILHNIYNPYKQDIVRNAPDSVYFHWMSWGADLYCHPALSTSHRIRGDRSIDKKGWSIKRRIGYHIGLIFPYYWYKYYTKNRGERAFLPYLSLFSKIRSVSTVLPNEMELVWRYYGEHLQYIPFKYGSIESFSVDNSVCKGENILVGNSATIANCHLTAFKAIRRVAVKGQKIICPLSYGQLSYRDEMVDLGNSFFGEDFVPLVDFMPLTKYNEILNSCSVVVMAHQRQQAMGNIIAMIWKGAKVFLDNKNPAYRFLRENGIEVFTLKDLSKINCDYNVNIDLQREKLSAIYSREKVLEETHFLVDKLLSAH